MSLRLLLQRRRAACVLALRFWHGYMSHRLGAGQRCLSLLYTYRYQLDFRYLRVNWPLGLRNCLIIVFQRSCILTPQVADKIDRQRDLTLLFQMASNCWYPNRWTQGYKVVNLHQLCSRHLQNLLRLGLLVLDCCLGCIFVRICSIIRGINCM